MAGSFLAIIEFRLSEEQDFLKSFLASPSRPASGDVKFANEIIAQRETTRGFLGNPSEASSQLNRSIFVVNNTACGLKFSRAL